MYSEQEMKGNSREKILEKQHARMVLGSNIRSLRAYYGLSRSTLAKLIRMPVGRLRRIESGDPNARLYDFHLYRLSKIFDVRMEMLFDDSMIPQE